MDLIESLAIINKLKQVERGGMAGNRHESTAEHTFSAMVLGAYYLKRIKGLNELRALKLILYHDLVEIYAGDARAWEGKGKIEKNYKEKLALKRLLEELPKELAGEIKLLNKEYESASTHEAKFAHAIDNFDAVIQNRSNSRLFRKYKLSVEFIKKIKIKYFEPFPLMKKDWENILERMVKRGITWRE